MPQLSTPVSCSCSARPDAAHGRGRRILRRRAAWVRFPCAPRWACIGIGTPPWSHPFRTWRLCNHSASLSPLLCRPSCYHGPRFNGERGELPPGRGRDAESGDSRALFTHHSPTHHCRAVALATGAEPAQPQGERKRGSRNERASRAKPTALGACANDAACRCRFGRRCCPLAARRPGHPSRHNRRAAVERGAVDGEANRQAIERATVPWGDAAVERVAGGCE